MKYLLTTFTTIIAVGMFATAMFSISLMLGGSVMAAPPDDKGDGTGWCDDLDAPSGLFSTCIQAYSSCANVAHLTAVGANANAVARAQARCDEDLATYADLPGGGVIPGFEAPPPPILVVAYINRDGVAGYDPNMDTLVAKLVDTNEDGVLSIGDTLTTDKYPLDFNATSTGSFTALSHIVASVIDDGFFYNEFSDAAGNSFGFGSNILNVASCDYYEEITSPGGGAGSPNRFIIQDGNVDVCGQVDVINAGALSPSAPDTPSPFLQTQTNRDPRRVNNTNDSFLDVDFLFD